MALTAIKSMISLSRQYTCLVVPRTEACLRLSGKSLHTSPAYKDKATTMTRKGARLSTEKQIELGMTATVTMKKDEMQPGVIFPTKETHSSLIDGVRYDQIPTLHVRATKNNTIASCEKHDGGGICMASAGAIGFKNARKGTNVAAQAVGAHLGDKLLRRGVDKVRVIVKGIGIGRLPCLKGLQLAGINIVSITDNTTVYTGKRPRKARRVG